MIFVSRGQVLSAVTNDFLFHLLLYLLEIVLTGEPNDAYRRLQPQHPRKTSQREHQLRLAGQDTVDYAWSPSREMYFFDFILVPHGSGLKHLMMERWKVDRGLANQSPFITASQGTSNIPFAWFLVLGCNRQARRFFSLAWRSSTWN